MKWLKWILSSAALLLALALGLLLFIQSEWAKDKIGTVLEEIALQQGLKLKIEKIEGELPLKWTFSQVHLNLNETDSIDIDRIRVRLSIMPLLRKQIRISYLSADKLIYRFIPKNENSSSSMSALPQSFSIRMMKLNQFEAINLTTKEKAIYTLSGSCNFKKRSFDLYAKMHSADLDGIAFVQGNKKTEQVSADLSLHVRSEKAFAPFAAIPFKTALQIKTQCAGSWKVWKNLLLTPHNPILSKPIAGNVQVTIERFALPQLQNLDKNLTATAEYFLFSDRSFDLSSLVLQSDLLDINGKGQFDATFFPKNVDFTFSLPHLSLLTPYLEGMVKGDIYYSGNDCRIAMTSDKFHLRKASFNDAHLNLQAHRGPEGWTGTFETAAAHPALEFKGTSNFKYQAHRLELQNLSLQALESSVVGDFALDLPLMTNLSGGVAFQINDLKPYSELSPLPLAGQIGGQIDFKGDDCRSHAIAKACKVGPFISDQVAIDLFATDIFKEIKGKFEIEIQKSYLADIFFTSGSYSMSWNSLDWTYTLKTQGEWKNSFDLASQGHFSYSPGNFLFYCDSFKGNLLQKNLELQQPFTLNLQKGAAELSDFRLKINEGYVHSSFNVSPQTSLMHIQAEHFPLDFLTLLSPRLSLQGLSSIDMVLEGTNNDLVGHFNLLLEHADIFPAGTTTPIQTKASFQANLNHDKIQLHSHIVATGQQFVELSATLPISYQVYPFQLHMDQDKSWAAQCTVEGHIEQLFDFINLGTQRFGGFLSAKLVSSGTWEKPALFGPFSIQNGFYQNYVIGISLKNAHLQAIANGSTVDVQHIDLTDNGEGTASANGLFKLEPTLPFSVEGHISHFRLVHFDWLTAACSGPFKITGNLNEAFAQGTLSVDEAEIQIPDQLPSNLPTLPVTFINQPESYTPPVSLGQPYAFNYDVKIQGEKNIHLTGHGIDAELAGDLQLTGENLDITTAGTLKVNKGKFSFSGKDFKITQGEVSFTKGESFINLTSNLDLHDLNVTVTFRGSFRSPQLNFQSNPPLPTSSILARILFNKDVSELNPSQAGQLAYTIISLSGGSGPNLLETIHKNLGIDRLGISSNEETGKVSVQIGKYLTEGVMITLSQSTEQSHVIVEVELKGGFVLQAETHFNDQGKYIFKWNKNY
jgi:autotransporter translocation and assembly factor TamB